MERKPKAARRRFLTGVVATAAAAPVLAARAATPDAPRKPSALPPGPGAHAAESASGIENGNGEVARINGVAGSDFMVDVIKTLNIKYVPANCASSFRGIHESLINYGGNKMPEFLTCTHEESAAAMAHGYFKVSGKPLMTLCHGTVGLQHAAMAIYNAFCDRVPIYILGGNTGGVGGQDVSLVFLIEQYGSGFDGQLGYASALSVLLFVLTAIPLLVLARLNRRNQA